MKVKKVYILMEMSPEKHISDKPVLVSFEPIILEEMKDLRSSRTYKVYDFKVEE